MKSRLSGVVQITVVCIASILTGPVRAQVSDPILNRKQVEVLINAHYAEEEKRLKAEIQRRKQNEVLYLTGKRLSEVKKALGDKNQIPPIVPIAAPPPNPCAPRQRVFVRRNGLDTFQLGLEPVSVSSAKGASVSVTQDDLADSTTISVNGRVQGILAANDPLSSCKDGKVGDPWATVNVNTPTVGYAIAPFVDGQGTITNPRKKGEASALQVGSDFQFSTFGGPLFDRQYFTVTPYYQTDFRIEGNVQGVKATWAPSQPDVHLGGRIGVPNEYLDWFWQFQAVYDARHVSDPGVTGLSNTNYQWVGAVAQLHIDLFPGRASIEPEWQPPYPSLVDRIYLNGMVNYYRDSNSGQAIHLFEVELGYNITDDGKSSMSIKYDKGTDKDTLQAMQKYLIGLNYKF